VWVAVPYCLDGQDTEQGEETLESQCLSAPIAHLEKNGVEKDVF
jgi:hypothetical protein